MNLKIIVPLAVIGIVVIASVAMMLGDSTPQTTIVSEPITESNVTVSEGPASTLTIMETDGQKHIIPLDKIKGGGPPKDGIPSIDDPKFTEISGSQFVSDSDVVIGLEINGDARAYPLFILVWHEIVNDVVGGTPVAVTYCPLCYTNQVFERIVNGNEVEFGTSGKLYQSNLLMYDRWTDSYWSQGLGMAVTGKLSGIQLKTIPFDVITWGDWKKLHPDSLVLTTDTGHLRSYATDPYGDYYTDPRIIFPVDNMDDRMHPKEIILGFHEDGIYKAYKQNDVELHNVINDNIGETSLMLVSLFPQNSRAFDRNLNGEILQFQYVDGKITDAKTESVWSYDGLAISGPLEGNYLTRISMEPGFWFSWVAFHPDTAVW
ncbi:MAG: DUF3179 domain-containing protein [Nitrosopumilaceae archaeon]|uniref:DUF3179 domain-containing protein n=2 Tax=Candidatus Nitrosomaritimum aestuariumsis TaxID=3342354 RepID=A0AC60W8J4_9ARCH|nr:DUF3179 domain-containing protein [Nitrosopumilaceae archaeon]MBA4460525.1 DUF3179 domain-containing protein [Nitrosopumilaceae archaeon]MBA4463569.1 DUF3179 domain-containing protein [Nitrosopumilaceae archaeon]